MSLGIGNNVKLAFAAQGAFGTSVARTAGLRVLEESLGLKQTALAKANLGHHSKHQTVKSKRAVDGDVKLYLPCNGGELFLKHAFGAEGKVTGDLDGGGNYYTRTFSLAATLLSAGLSLEVDRDAAAVGTAWLYDSCLINKLTLEQKLEDGLTMGLNLLGREETKVAATGALTYQSLRSFDWDQLVITLDPGTGAVEVPCEEFMFELDNVLDGDRHKFGTRLRKGISKKETRNCTGKITTELEAATYYDLFRDLTECELVATWTGRLLGEDSSVEVYESLVLTLPRITFNGTSPAEKDGGRIKLELPFQALATLDTDNSEASLVLVNATA